MDDKTKRLIEALKIRVKKHREAYGLDIFPNSDVLHENSTRDSVSARMGRHMCDCFIQYLDEALTAFEAESDTPHADGVFVPRDVIDKILGYTWNAENSERLEPLKALSRGGK